MTIFWKDLNSMESMEVVLDAFYTLSCLKVNTNKTSVLFLGQHENGNNILKLGKKTDIVKILGVYFSVDTKVKQEMNYKKIFSQIKILLGWWKQRDLTLAGKIQLLTFFALSKLTYVSAVMSVPA